MKYSIIKELRGVEIGSFDFKADSDTQAVMEFSHILSDTTFRKGLKLVLVEKLKGSLMYSNERVVAYATTNDEIIVHDENLLKTFN